MSEMKSTKDAERAELHRSIWAVANKLRGSVDGWDFKQYVIGMLFYRFISENLAQYINEGEHRAGILDFDYAKLSDEEAEVAKKDLIKTKGFYIAPSELFCNLKERAASDPNLNETLHQIFQNIEDSTKGAESEADFRGLFDDIDVNSKRLGATVSNRNDNIVNLLNGIGDMQLKSATGDNIDVFGDAYEYLMSMYASNAGKSSGEFFSPMSAGMLISRIAVDERKTIANVLDPTCGSGTLLTRVAQMIGKENVTDGFYGQDINITNYNTSRINMFLHGIDFNKFSLFHGDTIHSPADWGDKKFDSIVSNPPYSVSYEQTPTLINDYRFAPAGVLAPKSKGDFMFVLHCLANLSETGVAAIICFPGIFYRGGAEQKIRKYLVDNNYVDALIRLSDDQFYGTSISVEIIVLRKSKKDTNVVFVDGFDEAIKTSTGKEMTPQNIDNIYNNYKGRVDVPYKVKVISNKEIEENNYNLSVNSYVEKEDTREKVDIKVLNKEISEVVSKCDKLRAEIDKIIAEIEGDDYE